MEKLRRRLLISVWGLAGIALLTLVSTRELDHVTVLAVTFLYPLFYYFEKKDRLLRFRWMETGLILSLFVFSIFRLLILRDTFLMTVADFLTAFMLVKLMFKKESTDLKQIIVLSFFLLLSASTLALDFTYLFMFILYILMATWTLSLYTLEQGAREVPIHEIPEEREIFRILERNCALTLVLAIAFAMIIFVLFPRLSFAVFQGTFLGPTYKTGFSDKVILAEPGRIFEDPKIAMRVEIKEGKERNRTVWYLRGRALSQFDGKTWSVGPFKGVIRYKDGYRRKIAKLIRHRFNVLKTDQTILKKEFGMRLDRSSVVCQKIYLESIDLPLLFGVPWTESMTVKLSKIIQEADGTVSRPSEFSGRFAYEVSSIIERPSDSVLNRRSAQWAEEWEKRNTDSPKGILSANLEIPDEDFSKIWKLGRKIVSRKDSPYAKARKIERYLRQNYRYTLDPKPTQTDGKGKDGKEKSDSALGSFLFDTREGHCEYFASAMALMLRLEGIPARIVTGFLADEWNDTGHYYIVRAKDAHSWVESYMGGIWIEFDPSPRREGPAPTQISFWKRTNQWIDYLNFLWNANVLGYDMESQKELAKTIHLRSNRLSHSIDQTMTRWRKRFWEKTGRKIWKKPEKSDIKESWEKRNKITEISAIFPLIFFLVLAVFISSFLKYYFKKKRGGKTSFYGEFLNHLEKKGIHRHPHETPYEFLDRISGEIRFEEDSLRQQFLDHSSFLTTSFYEVRFSGNAPETAPSATVSNALTNLKKIIGVSSRTDPKG